MARQLSQLLLASLLGAFVLFAASHARAQSATPLAASDFTYYLQFYDPAQRSWVPMNPTQQAYFFNRARCECAGDTTNWSGLVRIAIQPAANTANKVRTLLDMNLVGSGSARLYAGGNIVNCLSPSTVNSDYCVNLLDPGNMDASIEGGMAVFTTARVWTSAPIPVAWLFNAAKSPVCSGGGCGSTESCTTTIGAVTIYFWAQTSALSTPDMTNSSFTLNLVGQPALTPENVAAEGGNEALTVTWGWPNGLDPAGNASFLGVQLLCVRGQDMQVFPPGKFDPTYMTSASMCPTVDASTPSPGGFARLDPSYLCSGLLPSTATSYRITGLQNDIPYGVGVAAVDKFGNLSLSDVVYASPTKDASPTASIQGGGCAVAGWHGRPGGLGGLGALGIGLLLGLRRRKRRRCHG